jgi:hypothetical protein
MKEISSMSLFICQFCGSERKNKKSLSAHQSFCKSNFDKSTHDHSKAGLLGNKKSRESRLRNIDKQKTEYYKNPNKCEQCKESLVYEKRNYRFCGNSCSAKMNNTLRERTYSEFSLYKLAFLKQRPDVIKVIRCRRVCKVCLNGFWVEKKSSAKTCSHECRKKIYSETAKNNPHMGGNKNNKAYGWYTSPTAGKVWLESSWEYIVAKSLDGENIKWIRPRYLTYSNKRYYPDFYLVDYDVYLDPKNPYLQQVDSEKIQIAARENSVRIIILSKTELTWNKIKSKIMLEYPSGQRELSCKQSAMPS